MAMVSCSPGVALVVGSQASSTSILFQVGLLIICADWVRYIVGQPPNLRAQNIDVFVAHHRVWWSQIQEVLVQVSSYGRYLVYWVGLAQAVSRSWDPQYH